MEVPDDYKVQDLLLLIGENPLPNYVAANLVLKAQGTIHLAHTTGTQRQAQQLKSVLQEDHIHCQALPLGDSEANASAIRQKIEQRIKHLDGSIGLHYTGGTKAMAVHTYQTLKEHRPNAIFSYLDPRRLELCIDQTSGDPKRFKLAPDMLQIPILKLIKLHGWNELYSEPLDRPIQPEAAAAFAKFHADANTAKDWHDWCHTNLRKRPNGDFKSRTNLNTIKIDLSSDTNFPKHPDIIRALQLLGMQENHFSFQGIRDQAEFSDSIKFAEWVDSFWLEHYTLHEVQKIANQQRIYDSVNSLTTKNPNTGEKKFEIDVVFTRGYQLFGLSCTTSASKSLCKSKLFEAYIRAQQLGGAEARVALVCCTNPEDTHALKTEVVNVFTSINATPENCKVEVFGREDLLTLSDKIAEWIQNVDRNTK
jgi:hypothetical protein